MSALSPARGWCPVQREKQENPKSPRTALLAAKSALEAWISWPPRRSPNRSERASRVPMPTSAACFSGTGDRQQIAPRRAGQSSSPDERWGSVLAEPYSARELQVLELGIEEILEERVRKEAD